MYKKALPAYGLILLYAIMTGCSAPAYPHSANLNREKSTRADSSDVRGTSLKWLKVSGRQILTADGNPVQLRGIAFGNQVWQNNPVPALDHDERDFKRLAVLRGEVAFYKRSRNQYRPTHNCMQQ